MTDEKHLNELKKTIVLKLIIEKINDPDVLFVSLADAAAVLGIAKSTAYASYRTTGRLVAGVPIRKTGRRRYLVATAHLRALSDPQVDDVA